jgi:acetolactate synthase-1/3 small subunit
MASVCGRFASRAFNVEGIICLPLAHDPTLSRIWLMVHEEAEMEQLIHQLVKMVDVISIQRREAAEDTFRDVESLFA